MSRSTIFSRLSISFLLVLCGRSQPFLCQVSKDTFISNQENIFLFFYRSHKMILFFDLFDPALIPQCQDSCRRLVWPMITKSISELAEASSFAIEPNTKAKSTGSFNSSRFKRPICEIGWGCENKLNVLILMDIKVK